MAYLHGVETIEIDSGPRPVTLVKTAVIGLIGTAAAGAVNEPILVTREADFAQFGEAIPGSTILPALNRIYKQKGTVVIVLNVLDPSEHKTAVPGESVALDLDGGFALAHAAVADAQVLSSDSATTYVLDTDYTLDPRTGKGARIEGGAIPAATLGAPVSLKVNYTYLDPTRVPPSALIGTIDAAGRRRGMKAFRDSYQLFGYFPKILLAPVFGTLNSVSAELIATATSIRAFCFINAPAGVTVQQAITARGPAGSINFNTSSRRVGLCFPHVKDYDVTTDSEVLADLATYAAGALSRKDQENGYWWSPSNTELLGVTGVELPIYAMINDPNSEANLLNEAGILTVFNSFGTGIRLWGNRSAAFPSETHPKNFINVLRTADIIAESLEYYTLQYIDRPLDDALIDAIVESSNAFLRKLKTDDAIIDGECWYEPADNEATELAAGHVTFTYDFMPKTPAERVTYKSIVNIDYLKSLGAKAA
jgi:phage tail sheath protein FI